MTRCNGDQRQAANLSQNGAIVSDSNPMRRNKNFRIASKLELLSQ